MPLLIIGISAAGGFGVSARYRSVIALAAVAALVAACLSAVPPADRDAPPSLSGTSWVLEPGTNIPGSTQPTSISASPATEPSEGVTPAGAPAPLQVAWLLPDRGWRPILSFSADRSALPVRPARHAR